MAVERVRKRGRRFGFWREKERGFEREGRGDCFNKKRERERARRVRRKRTQRQGLTVRAETIT